MRRALLLLPFAALAVPLAAALRQPLSPHAPGLDDRFLREAARDSLAQIAEGSNAIRSAGSAEVKAFAQQLVNQQGAAISDLEDLARARGTSVPSALKDRQAQLEQERGQTGTSFDAIYLADQIADQRRLAAALRAEIDHGGDPSLKAYAARSLPLVEHALKRARSLATSEQG